MRQVIGRVQRRSESLFGDGKALLQRSRERSRWFDHQARAFERYQERRGDRLAAALTSYAFLSFFPLMALAYALLGYLVGVSDEARAYFVRAINSQLPGLAASSTSSRSRSPRPPSASSGWSRCCSPGSAGCRSCASPCATSGATSRAAAATSS
ncbi:hypothetical protein ACFQY7_33415 [Actinomadura luteofluorescens]|uniref:hypothetical protein n=1 Tax=Actinomadura luteofluorescens TaxID=46163 RepID=UPI003634FDC8